MSETPRTDEVSDRTTRTVAVWVLARDLERENAAKDKQIAALIEQIDNIRNCDNCDLCWRMKGEQ